MSFNIQPTETGQLHVVIKKLLFYILKNNYNINTILIQNICLHHFCLAGTYCKSFKRHNKNMKRQWIACVWIHSHTCKTNICTCVFVLQSDSRLVFQLPVLGVFSCRLCRARSVHFISCSFTDSVDPPLSCSASGSSLWQRTEVTRCHEKGEHFTQLYINSIMVSRQKLNIWGRQKMNLN